MTFGRSEPEPKEMKDVSGVFVRVRDEKEAE